MANRLINFQEKIKQLYLGGDLRTLKMKKNIIQIFFLRGISVLIYFLLVRLILNYLNANDYGIWLTLSSIITWIEFFDIGLGHGLRNKLSEALANNNFELAKQYVSTTFVSLTIISVIIFILYLIVNNFLDWGTLLNISNKLGNEVSIIMLWLVALFCLRFVLRIISVIIVAYQEPALETLIGVIGSILSIIAIYIAIVFTNGSLKLVAMILSIAPTLIFAISSILLFKYRYYQVRPRLSDFNTKHLRELLGLGMKFFVIQLSLLLIFSSSNFIIINLFGPKEVTHYNIAYKYFSIIVMIFTIIVTPLWAAFTESYVKGDLLWIEKTSKTIRKMFLVSLLFILLFVLIADFFYKIWIGIEFKIPFSLTLSMAIYVVVYNLLSSYIYLINGVGKILVQMLISIFSIIVYIPLALLFSDWFGVSGPINATTVLLIPLTISAYIQYKKIISSNLTGIWNR